MLAKVSSKLENLCHERHGVCDADHIRQGNSVR